MKLQATMIASVVTSVFISFSLAKVREPLEPEHPGSKISCCGPDEKAQCDEQEQESARGASVRCRTTTGITAVALALVNNAISKEELVAVRALVAHGGHAVLARVRIEAVVVGRRFVVPAKILFNDIGRRAFSAEARPGAKLARSACAAGAAAAIVTTFLVQAVDFAGNVFDADSDVALESGAAGAAHTAAAVVTALFACAVRGAADTVSIYALDFETALTAEPAAAVLAAFFATAGRGTGNALIVDTSIPILAVATTASATVVAASFIDAIRCAHGAGAAIAGHTRRATAAVKSAAIIAALFALTSAQTASIIDTGLVLRLAGARPSLEQTDGVGWVART